MDNNFQWPPQNEGKPPKKKTSFKKMGSTVILVFLAIILASGLLSCFYTVNDKQQAVVTKRTHVWGDHSRTTYFATFQFPSGDRLELEIPRDRFGYLVEGDSGKLHFQGTRFLDFQRQ